MTDGVVDNPGMNRFELRLDDDAVAALYYRAENNALILLHTEVPYEFSGEGIGTRLATAVFEELRRSDRKAVAKCPFVARFVARHPEYSDLIAG